MSRRGKSRFRRHLAGAVENDDFGQIAKRRLVGQILVQQRRLIAKLDASRFTSLAMVSTSLRIELACSSK